MFLSRCKICRTFVGEFENVQNLAESLKDLISSQFLLRCLTFSDVNVAFQQAAHKVLLDDDNLLPLLHLTVDYQGKDGKGGIQRPSPRRSGGFAATRWAGGAPETTTPSHIQLKMLVSLCVCQRPQVPGTELLPRRTRPLVKSPPRAGQPSASPTRSSGRCTSSSRPPSWRSASSSSYAAGRCALWPPASPAPCLLPQVQRCVQVPVERPARAVSAAALLGSADAEETPEIHPDGRREVAATQPHGLSD